jgi:hypothetical protein
MPRYVRTAEGPKRVTSGPFLWDGSTAWGGSAGAVVESTAQGGGYAPPPILGSAPLPNPVTPEEYGATGDGTTDDTAAVQQAVNVGAATGRGCKFSPRTYSLTSVSVPAGALLEGTRYGNKGNPGTMLLGADKTVPVLSMTGGSVMVRELGINGGGYAIARMPEAVGQISYVYLERVAGTGNRSGLYLRGPASEWWIRDCTFYGNGLLGVGGYGIDAEFDGSQPGALDGFNMYDVRPGGVAGAMKVLSVTSNQWVLRRVGGTGAAGHTVILGGSCAHWLWEDCYFAEDQGGTDQTPENYDTTGSITSGSNVLAVASATGYATGTQVTVAGAGAFGAHLVALVQSVAGTNLTLDTNAGTAVTGAAVTAAKWDTINCQNYLGTAPSGHTVLNCEMGRGSGSTIRYGWNGGGSHTFINHTTFNTSPIYDPEFEGTYINLAGPVRVRSAIRYPRLAIGRGAFPYSGLASGQGVDFRLGLVDSAGNGTGTFGEFGFWTQEGSGTKVASITKDGAIKSRSRTTAQRPSAATVGAGARIWDSDLGKPIWSNGSAWVDATGTVV